MLFICSKVNNAGHGYVDLSSHFMIRHLESVVETGVREKTRIHP